MSVTHRSLSIAVESSFGSLDSNGLPSTSGLTYISIPCERDPIVIYGEPIASERNDARDGSYGLPPTPFGAALLVFAVVQVKSHYGLI